MINAGVIKAYDVRGVYPTDFSDETAVAIARAYARWLKPKSVVVGHDVRESSPHLTELVTEALLSMGVDVIDIGLISTDMLYYAVATLKTDGGLTITASHNPREYNGMKLVREEAKPISGDTGLQEIAELLKSDDVPAPDVARGSRSTQDILEGYIAHIRSFIDPAKLKPLKVVINGNFGLAAQVIQEALHDSPIEWIPLNDTLDGSFPKGRPDPLIPENRQETADLILAKGADLGIAWDADADRCFFLDSEGEFVDGYYMVAILAEIMLKKAPGAAVIYDPRGVWAIQDHVTAAGGIPLINKAGHAFIKERMRKENAIFGGEMSAHYYFRDNFFCDNGMIPALLMLEHLSVTGLTLKELAASYKAKYFISGEINSEVKDADRTLETVENAYSDGKITQVDGLSVEYPTWRFNLRKSNTEPIARLNVEAKDAATCTAKTDELLSLVRK